MARMNSQSSSSVWQPRGMCSMSPFHMRTTIAQLAYFVGFPLIYVLFYACFQDMFSFAIKSFITALWGGYHVAAPFLIWVYETRNNPYAFAPGMMGRASREEERELLEANRRVVKWFVENDIFLTEFKDRPPGIGFRESSPPSSPNLL